MSFEWIDRLATSELTEALRDTPVVLLHGPRQCGKSALANHVLETDGRRYITFDNPRHLEEAKRNPLEFLERYADEKLALDEIQRVPEIFLPMKLRVDRSRNPGQYLLTGSANILALPKVADSLAGRMVIIDLLPFAQTEIAGTATNLVDCWFENRAPKLSCFVDKPDICDRIVTGGYPEAVARPSVRSRDRWFENYLRTIIERDVRDIANIEALVQMPRLMRLLAGRSSSTINVSSLSRETGIPNTSLHRYLDLLQTIFMLVPIPTWSNNRGPKLIKSAKSFFVDSGLLCHLDNIDHSRLREDPYLFDTTLKSFVALELIKQARYSLGRPIVHHLRTVKNLEVDFVLEAKGGQVVGVEVSGASALGRSPANRLRYLQELAGEKFVAGIVLYCGSEVEPLTDKITAVPLSCLWS